MIVELTELPETWRAVRWDGDLEDTLEEIRELVRVADWSVRTASYSQILQVSGPDVDDDDASSLYIGYWLVVSSHGTVLIMTTEQMYRRFEGA